MALQQEIVRMFRVVWMQERSQEQRQGKARAIKKGVRAGGKIDVARQRGWQAGRGHSSKAPRRKEEEKPRVYGIGRSRQDKREISQQE